MVEVLRAPPSWGAEMECEGCSALVRVGEGDLRVGSFGASWGGETPESLPYFECPACGSHQTLRWGDLPGALRARLGAAG